MLTTAHAPTVTRIVKASRAAPYLSFALNLDPALITGLAVEMGGAGSTCGPSTPPQDTAAEVAETALRLVRLLDRPGAVPILQAQLVREMHYWLLAGRHGPALRELGFPTMRARGVAQAVDTIRANYAGPLRVTALAAGAGMSPSTFHKHFRAATSLSPVQFQKQLRLIEARRLMLARGIGSSQAAYAVGYESAPQFTREYRRFFGLPPGQDTARARIAARAGPS
jgi:AraC-like DNA-binding protein